MEMGMSEPLQQQVRQKWKPQLHPHGRAQRLGGAPPPPPPPEDPPDHISDDSTIQMIYLARIDNQFEIFKMKRSKLNVVGTESVCANCARVPDQP